MAIYEIPLKFRENSYFFVIFYHKVLVVRL